MARGSGWRGRMVVFPGRLLYVGAIGPTDVHAHHAFQLGWALGGGTLRLADESGSAVTAGAVLVPADAPHSVVDASPRAAMLFVDPESREGRALRALGPDPQSSRAWSLGESFVSARTEDPYTLYEAATFADAVIASLVRDLTPRRAIHPAVRRALALLAAELPRSLRLAALAREVELSEGRLRHVFADEIGISLRRYVLWCRLMAVAEAVQEGCSLTEAAHRAGFSDSAHLTKTFRSMFGLAPSDATAGIEWVIASS